MKNKKVYVMKINEMYEKIKHMQQYVYYSHEEGAALLNKYKAMLEAAARARALKKEIEEEITQYC